MWMHRLGDVDTEGRTAMCAECGHVKVKRRKNKSGSYGWRCTGRLVDPPPRELMQDDQNRHRRLRRALQDRRGPSCEICGATDRLVVDHCHEKMIYRGTLCAHCNSGLGHFRDNPALLEAAAAYLRA